MDTKDEGQIRITVQTEDRMKAITELAQAINKLAGALSVTPTIYVTDNVFNTTDVVYIDTSPDVTETTIYKVDSDSDA